MKASTQRAAAGRTLAVLAEGDDAVTLVLDLCVLLSERLALGLRFLPVSHPFRTARFQQSLGVLELGTLLLQLERRFLFESGRFLDPRVTLLEPRNLFAQRGFRLEQRLPPPLLSIESVERLQLDVERKEWLNRVAQRGELRPGRLNVLHLAHNPLNVALERCLFFLRDRDLCEQQRGLLPLALHHFPSGLDRHHLALANRAAMRRLLRARFRFFLS